MAIMNNFIYLIFPILKKKTIQSNEITSSFHSSINLFVEKKK